MSRQLWCSSCGDRQNKIAGTHCVYERHPATEDEPAEPAEYERVAWGRARRQPFDRAHPLVLESYICDGCGAPINIGDRCMGWTIWREGMTEPPAWEHEYLE